MSSPGTGGPAAQLAVDPAALSSAAGILESTAGTLADAAPDLHTTPDAGVSSTEVATALGALAEAVTGLAAEVGTTAESVRTTAADMVATDQAVSASSEQRRAGLVP